MKQGTTEVREPKGFKAWSKRMLGTAKAKMVTAIVPRHTRRAIFACSLAAHFFPDNKELHDRLARRLVKELNLICAHDSMLAPMAWSTWIWSALPAMEITKGSALGNLSKLTGKVIESTPVSLRYANPRVMEEDILNTLRTVKDLRAE